MFDTAAAAIIFPEVYFDRFLKELFSGMKEKEYELADGYVVTKCYDDFPVVHFMFGESWVSVNPDEYVADASQEGDRSLCVLMMTQGTQSFMVMGIPVYSDYYTVHEEENSRIGFAPRVGSKKEALIQGSDPERSFGSSNPPEAPVSIWSWVITSSILLCFIGLWVWIVLESGDGRRGRRNNDNDAQTWTMAIIGAVFVVAMAFLLYFFVQPLINSWIVPASDDYSASYASFAAPEGITSEYGAYGGVFAAIFLAYKMRQNKNQSTSQIE